MKRFQPLFLSLLFSLSACVPVVMIAGGSGGIMALHDRRSIGTQTDDEGIEWKAIQQVPEKYASVSHKNYTSFNRRVLITGEAPNESVRQGIGDAVLAIKGVKEVYNEMVLGENSSLASRSNDSYITSKVKGKLVDTKNLSANHIKVITEAGVVYLMGIVNAHEAQLATEAARVVSGVKKVVSLFEIVSEEETRQIDESMKGSANTSSSNVLQTEN